MRSDECGGRRGEAACPRQVRTETRRETGRPSIDSDHRAGRRRLRRRLYRHACPGTHRHASLRADRSGKRSRESPGFRSHGYACNGSRSGGRTGSLTDPNLDASPHFHAAAHSNAGSHTRAGLDSHAHASAGPHGHSNVVAHGHGDTQSRFHGNADPHRRFDARL